MSGASFAIERRFRAIEDKLALLIVQDLYRVGWNYGRLESVPHKPDDAVKVFCSERCWTNKLYLKCVLQLERLWAEGLCELHFGKGDNYYKLCLVSAQKATIQHGLKDCDQKKALLDLGIEPEPDNPDDCVTEYHIALHGLEAPLALADEEHESHQHEPPPELEEAAAPDSETSSDEAVTYSLAKRRRLGDREYVEGMLVIEENRHELGVARHTYARIRIRCPFATIDCSGHEDCDRSRTLSQRHIHKYGRKQAIAYSGVWASKAIFYDTKESHKLDCKPTMGEIKDYMKDHGMIH